MIGTAYEVAALYNTKMTKPETTSNELELSANDELTVTIAIIWYFIFIFNCHS
jgi:phenylalanyl-tRNA synthetase beta chain